MDWDRKKKIILRWSLVSMTAIGLFWLVWYLIHGYVPVVTNIKIFGDTKIFGDWTYTLPFGVPRWVDVLIGPIWSTILVLVFTSTKITKTINNDGEDEDLDILYTISTVIGVIGLFIGLSTIPAGPLLINLPIGALVGFFSGMGIGKTKGPVTGLICGIEGSSIVSVGIGLSAASFSGLCIGIIAGLSVILGGTLGAAGGVGSVIVSRKIISFRKTTLRPRYRHARGKVGDWLLVRTPKNC